MTIEVEQAVVTKGVATPAPFILLHPPPFTTSCSPVITIFKRPTGLLFQYLVNKIMISPRYSSVIILGLEEHPRLLVPLSSSSSSSSSRSNKVVLVDGFSDPLGLYHDEGTVALTTPEALVEAIQSQLEKQSLSLSSPPAPPQVAEPSPSSWCALLIDSLDPLLHTFGLRGCLRFLDLVRRRLPHLSPMVTVLFPYGLPPSTILSLEDHADTNIYLEPCTSHHHATSRSPPQHGRCRVVRKSSSGRVQEGVDYYQCSAVGSRGGKIVLEEGSCCPLVTRGVEQGDQEGEEDDGGGSNFLEDLTAQLRLKEGNGGGAGEVAIMGSTSGNGQPVQALIFMEEGDPEFDDEDDDDGLDDDLDL